VVNSTDAALSASRSHARRHRGFPTLAICRAVIRPRGFTQNSTAVIREICRPVMADNLDFKVLLEPICHDRSRAIRQKIHDLTTL
jgi:hypothetical protein